jgi:type II restriction/modification system DNA methylase subunit YeeA
MKSGGLLGLEEIDWFNGGLFDDDNVLPLEKTEIDEILDVSRLDWSSIEPSSFGTLFERGLDPDKRSQLGAHFTDPRSIMRIVEPVVLAPLRAEWEGVRQEIAALMMQRHEIMGRAAGKSDVDVSKGLTLTLDEVAALKAQHHRPAAAASAVKLFNQARSRCEEFLHRLEDFRVLDPACGSGNFLYLSLLCLKDSEHQVITEAEALGLPKVFPAVGPRSVMGIEVNLYAAELARVTIWIGQIQRMLRHGWGLSRDPILKPLHQIDRRDALLNPDGTEAPWPDANCIVTNPPFLGDKRILSELGEKYTMQLRQVYGDRLPASADYVTYWFQKAWEKVAVDKTNRAGLVATQSIRKGSNRTVLDAITARGVIFNAWSDEPWVLDGAAVRVSIVCFGRASDPVTAGRHLNGHAVANIYSDLNAQGLEETSGVDFTQARPIGQNRNVCFQGPVKVGPFEIPGNLARKWLLLPSNPNGRPNSDVVRPWANGKDITSRPKDTWIIDFGVDTKQGVAAFYQEPFEYVREHVKKRRDKNKDTWRRDHWWLHGRSGEELRAAVKPFDRYTSTPRVAKHRFFVWLHRSVLPDSRLNAIARGDYTTFGILHSRFHIAWFLKTSSRHGVGNDPTYNARSVFETFSSPLGLTPDIPAADYASDPIAMAIADAARSLDEMRERWLNPPELVRREPEVLPGYPDRIVPLSDKAMRELKKRTLTKLYNARPAWLEEAHARLDAVVASAYRWPVDISDDEALRNLLQLNQERTEDERPVVAIEGADDNDVNGEDAAGEENKE